MITNVVTPIVPGRMGQKEIEQFLAEARVTLNEVGRVRRSLTTSASGVDEVIWSSPPVPKNSTVNLTFFVRASNGTATGAYLHYNYMFERGTGSVSMAGFSAVDVYIGASQSAAAVITADEGIAVTVNDGSLDTYHWDAWIELRI